MTPTPVKSYVMVFAALVSLTIVTVVVAYVDLGAFNTPAALIIAAIKAVIVMIFFMHLGRADRSVGISLGSCFFLLAVLVVLCLSDLFTRSG